ncbi:MAG TPA: SDR family oxidoreductase [Thermoanaerobaculia bacterium]|jgi:NAD(P)H dehydrogenase (quinone)|nr:SDR family oxidoreductase [Thermoanaerobaculia bacterium]
MIVVTGATGHLGRLVIEQLLQRVPPTEIAVAVRNVDKAADFAAKGIDVRHADYSQPETLTAAFQGADKILLISANEIGKRLEQHRNAVDAIKGSGAKLLVYTSILKADTSGISLATEHLGTEELIRASGVPFVFLRNGWYHENYTENLGPTLQYGAIAGSAGDGKVAAAARADYAAAAVEALTGIGHEGTIYELAGDRAFTLTELAAEVSRAAGKPVVYNDLAPAQYRDLLVGAGLPEPVAEMLVDADLGLKRGELDSDRDDLRRLIGRPTTPLADAVSAATRE